MCIFKDIRYSYIKVEMIYTYFLRLLQHMCIFKDIRYIKVEMIYTYFLHLLQHYDRLEFLDFIWDIEC